MLASIKKCPNRSLLSSLYFSKSHRPSPNDKIIGYLSKNVFLANYKTEVSDADYKLKLLKMEYKIKLETGAEVPLNISDKDWQKLVKISSHIQRMKFYYQLYKNEVIMLNKKKLREEKRVAKEVELIKQREKNGEHINYGLFHNSMFTFINYQAMSRVYGCWRQLSAVMFDQILVIDLDYEHLMTQREITSTALQIQKLYGVNKTSKYPWNLYLCNTKPNSFLLKRLKLSIPNLQSPTCLISVTEKSYLDIFPREKLIYLSGNATKIMKTLDHDAIYIIGGFVDWSTKVAASIGKAKKEKLAAFQLPINKYLPQGTRSKNLAIHHVAGILLDLKASGDWETALKRIPSYNDENTESLFDE